MNASKAACALSLEITGHAADSQHAGLLVQDVQHLVDVDALFVADKLAHSRVDVTASRSHNQTL